MKWFQHDSNWLDRPEMHHVLDRHGCEGTHGFMRLMEIFADHFNPEMPDTFIESKRDIFAKAFPRTCRRTARNILSTFQELGFIKYKFYNKEIMFRCSIIKDLADEYTKKILKNKNA